MTSTVKAALYHRNVANRRMANSQTRAAYLTNRQQFILLKRQFTTLLLQEKSSFFRKNANNQKKLWATLKQLLKKDRAQTTPIEISPASLNRYYIEMGQHGVPHPMPQPVHGESNSASSFQFNRVQPETVKAILKEMAAKNKSAGPDGVPP